MTCRRLAAATVAVLALSGCGRGQELLPASVLHAIEKDSGFLLMPPGSKIADQGARRDCVDASGDAPTTWRELDPAGLSIPEVSGFFRTRLPQLGWAADSEDGPSVDDASSSRWSRNFGGRPVLMHIWLEHDIVTVKAVVACG